MATEKLGLDYLVSNQSQKETVFNENMNKLDDSISDIDSRLVEVETNGTGTGSGYDDTVLAGRVTQNEDDIEAIDTRVSDLENGSGTGSGYDDTALTGRVEANENSISTLSTSISNIESENTTQNSRIETLENAQDVDVSQLESDVQTLQTDVENIQTSQTNISNSFDTLENDVNGYTQRIADIEQSQTTNDTAINSNTNRITTLENSGGSGGYDDTEVRGLITQNSDDVTALENRVETLETNGTGTGGGDMPQVGEVRQFVREYIPTGWSEISLAPVPVDDTIDWIFKDISYLKYDGNSTRVTSSLSTYSTTSSSLDVFNKNSMAFESISSENFYKGVSYIRDTIIQIDNSDTLYIYDLDQSLNSTLITYDLINNTYTTTNNIQDVSGYKTDYDETFYITSKNGDVVYTFDGYDIDGGEIIVTRYEISTDTFSYNVSLMSDINSTWTSSQRLFDHAYFDSYGDLIFTSKSNGAFQYAIKVDKDNLTISDVTSDSNILFSDIDFNIVNNSIYAYMIWIGDDQLMINKDSGDMVNTKDNGSYLKYRDQFDINLDDGSGSKISDFWFDEDGNVYRYIDQYKSCKNVKKIDGASNVVDNNVVYCVYNG